MKKDSSIIARVATIAGLALGAFALSALATGGTWTAPTASAPGGNVDAPINVGGSTQTKVGSIVVNGLGVNYLTIASGTNSLGNVLTNDGNGNAYWAPAGNGGSLGLYPHVNFRNANPDATTWGGSKDPTTIAPWESSTAAGNGGSNVGPLYCTSLNASQYCSDRSTVLSSFQCNTTAGGSYTYISSSNTWGTQGANQKTISQITCATTYSGDINANYIP